MFVCLMYLYCIFNCHVCLTLQEAMYREDYVFICIFFSILFLLCEIMPCCRIIYALEIRYFH